MDEGRDVPGFDPTRIAAYRLASVRRREVGERPGTRPGISRKQKAALPGQRAAFSHRGKQITASPPDSRITDTNDSRLVSVVPFQDGYTVTYEGDDRGTWKRPEDLTEAEQQLADLVLADLVQETCHLMNYLIDFDRLPDPALPMPAALERTDGGLVLYRQRVNWLSAAVGKGKTWIAMLVSRYLIGETDCRVAWLDFDNGTGEDLADRAPVLGMADLIRDRERFWCLPGSVVTTDNRYQLLEWRLAGPAGGFVVLDSATKASCPIDGDPRDWLAETIDPYQQARIGVLVLDHVSQQPKTGPAGWLIKGATLNGAMLRASGRCWDRHNDGHIDLTIDGKDRAGAVVNTDGRVTRIRGTWQDGALGIDIAPPHDVITSPNPGDSSRNNVLEHVRTNPGTTATEIAKALDIPRQTVYGILNQLDGQIVREKHGRDVRLYLQEGTNP